VLPEQARRGKFSSQSQSRTRVVNFARSDLIVRASTCRFELFSKTGHVKDTNGEATTATCSWQDRHRRCLATLSALNNCPRTLQCTLSTAVILFQGVLCTPSPEQRFAKEASCPHNRSHKNKSPCRGLEHELTVTAVLTKTQPVDVGKISGTDRTSLVLNVTH